MLSMEPTEIQEFSNHMREAGEASLTRISLAISILAVLVAMVTVLSHRSHTEAVLMQSRAGDRWNEYQAKKIRSESLSNVVDLLALQPVRDTAASAKKSSEYRAHLDKWNSDLAEDQKAAREYEAEVRRAEKKASRYDLGEALLQIAVVLSSITLLTRQRTYFVFGLALGLAGILTAATAVFL